jgi:hypothetical protein
LGDSCTPPGHVLFGRRLEQLAGLLKDARKAHEDATHKAMLKKTKPLPFPKRDRQQRVSTKEQQTAQAGATETSS